MSAETEGYIQTYSGMFFYPQRPDPSVIEIDDIATALSRIPRFVGHSIHVLSVAEHCVNVAKFASPENQLTALMHDASEAYLVDIPRPIKPMLKGYYELEAGIMEAIAEKFGFQWPLPAEVKELDTRHLTDEREQNMAFTPVPPEEWGNPLPALGVELQFWTPQKAKYEFLTAFYRYGGRR